MNLIERLRNQMMVTSVATMTSLPVAFAEGGNAGNETDVVSEVDKTVNPIITSIAGVALTIFRYVGVLLLIWGVGMLVMAFRNEDADSKSRAIMLIVVSVVLIALKSLVKMVLGSIAGLNIEL